MGYKTPEWKLKFIAERAYEMTDREMSKALDLPVGSIQNIRLSKGLKRNTRNVEPERKKAIITMLEDYWCNYTPIQTLASRYKMDTSNISRQIQHLFKLPINNKTEVITLKSKV